MFFIFIVRSSSARDGLRLPEGWFVGEDQGTPGNLDMPPCWEVDNPPPCAVLKLRGPTRIFGI